MTLFVTLAEIERALMHDKPRLRFIVPGVLPAGPCLLYGASGAGKTGIAIRTVTAAAAGLQWADRPIEPGAVLYVCGEDIDGAKERLVAAARALGREPSSLPVAVMPAPEVGVGKTEARHAITSAAKELARQSGFPVVLIVIDTLAACFGEKSQDDASAASEYMNSADRMSRDLGCCVLSVHHTGKNEEAGMRGSRVFFDRADAVLKVKRGQEGTAFLQVEKLRNGPGGARFAFDIGGEEIDTAAGRVSVQVIRDLRPMTDAPANAEKVKETRKQTLADQMLGVLIRLSGSGAVLNSTWQSACYELWPDKKQKTRRKLFSENRKRLCDSSLIRIEGETVSVSASVFQTDASLTPMPETVSVSASAPVSIDTGLTDALTGDPQKQNGKDGAEGNPEADDMVSRTNVLDRGAGGEAPALNSRPAGAGADGRATDAA